LDVSFYVLKFSKNSDQIKSAEIVALDSSYLFFPLF
jgi:hypothetical protein